jgi:cytochrome c-type protein NapC
MRSSIAFAALVAAAAIGPAPAYAAGIDWSGVQGKEVTLFYPGQSSWEWSLTQADHGGAQKFREGKNCGECHDPAESKTNGQNLVSGKKNEPKPIAGKPPFVVANVKVAHDAERFYVHLEFAEGNQPDAKQDPEFATKVAFMLSDGKVAEATRGGCWGTCHDDTTNMPAAGGKDRSKYLSRTRAKNTRQGGGDELKAADELQKMRADGQYLEYWQAKVNPGKPAVAADGIVFDKREEMKSPAVAAEATFTDGKWSVTLSRKLAQGAPYKDIAPGKTYTFGLAIHSGHTATRFHYVSVEQSLVLDQGSGNFVAVKK